MFSLIWPISWQHERAEEVEMPSSQVTPQTVTGSSDTTIQWPHADALFPLNFPKSQCMNAIASAIDLGSGQTHHPKAEVAAAHRVHVRSHQGTRASIFNSTFLH